MLKGKIGFESKWEAIVIENKDGHKYFSFIVTYNIIKIILSVTYYFLFLNLRTMENSNTTFKLFGVLINIL